MTTFVVRIPLDRLDEYAAFTKPIGVRRGLKTPNEAAALRWGLGFNRLNAPDIEEITHAIDIADDDQATLFKLFWSDHIAEPWTDEQVDDQRRLESEELDKHRLQHKNFVRTNRWRIVRFNLLSAVRGERPLLHMRYAIKALFA